MGLVNTLINLIKLRVDRRTLENDFVLKSSSGAVEIPRYLVIRQQFDKGGAWGTSYTYTTNENGTLSKTFAPAKLQPSRPIAVTTLTGDVVYSNILAKTQANVVTATINTSGLITLSAAPSSFYPSINVHSIYKLDSDETCADYQMEDVVSTPEIMVSRHALDTIYDNTGSGLAATNVQDALDEIAGGAVSIVSESGTFSTNSLTYIDVDGMSITPAAGTHMLFFLASAENTGGTTIARFAILKNGVEEAVSIVDFENANVLPIPVQGIITANGTDVISIGVKITAGNSITIYHRRLILK